MSTKTTFKRIALVAVAALGFGVLSVAPSQATVLELTVSTPTAGSAGAVGARTDSSTASTFSVSALFGAGLADTVTVQFVQGPGDYPTGATSVYPVLAFLETTTSTASVVDTETAQFQTKVTAFSATESVTASGLYSISRSGNGYAGAKFGLFLESATSTTRPAGDYKFTVIVTPYNNGTAGVSTQRPVTITVAAAAVVVATPAAANATAVLEAGAPTNVTSITDSVTAGSFLATGTPIGKIKVTNRTNLNATANDTITVSMTGVGYLVGPSSVTGRNFVIANVPDATISVLADGTSGTGTITLTTAAGASFVKTVTFFDTKPVKATATVAKAFIKAGTTATDDVFAITVTDTLGNAIKQTGVTVTAAPTDTATTVGGAATCAWNVKGDAYHCSVAGLSATKFGPVAYTIKATGTGVNLATVVSTSATVTFADNVATKAVLAGPATGNPGAEVEYTLTLTEKNGYPVADMIYGVGGATAPGGVLFSATAADRVASGWGTPSPFSASESFTSKSGVITSKGILPVAGTASLSLTLVGDGIQTASTDAIDKTIGKTKVTASTEVTNPGVDAATDAANEATDAANAATDAALAAAEAADAATTAAQEASDAVAALSESVTKLIAGLQAQIKSLAAVVAKIAKKVKA